MTGAAWVGCPAVASRKVRSHKKVAAFGPIAKAVEGPHSKEDECCSPKGRTVLSRQNHPSRLAQHLATLYMSVYAYEPTVPKPGLFSITLIHFMPDSASLLGRTISLLNPISFPQAIEMMPSA